MTDIPVLMLKGADGKYHAIPALKGEKGDQGIQGPTGLTGPKGDRGEPGPRGEAGVMDTALDADSTNGVQNKVLVGEFGKKADKSELIDYALKSEIPDVSGKADKSEIPDVSGLATKTELTTGLAGKQPTGDYAYKSEIPSIAGLATEEYVNSKVSSVYRVMGSCTTAELASKAKVTGDVWNLTDAGSYGPAGTNVVYNGMAWDALGGTYDLSEFVKKSGGTMTGKLTVGKASMDTNGYVVGTWIQATDTGNLNSAPTEYAVLSNGWIYKRTLEQTKEDLGINAKADMSAIPDISGKADQSDLTALASRVTALENIPNANGVSF